MPSFEDYFIGDYLCRLLRDEDDDGETEPSNKRFFLAKNFHFEISRINFLRIGEKNKHFLRRALIKVKMQFNLRSETSSASTDDKDFCSGVNFSVVNKISLERFHMSGERADEP